jgi:carbon-monoxide dehydrogenase medium subunit
MKPPRFSYHDPRSTADVVGLLATLDNAKLLAGGQSLMPMLNMRFVLPDHVIDLNRVDGLSYIRDNDGALEIGAMTRQRDIEFSDLVRRRCPLMHEAIAQVGHRQTRNRGTLGGSLCHLDPAAELVAVAAALDARLTVTGKGAGTRRTSHRRGVPLLAGTPRPCLCRIFPAARRFCHCRGSGADRGRRRRQGDARGGDARRHGTGAGPHE